MYSVYEGVYYFNNGSLWLMGLFFLIFITFHYCPNV